MMNFINRQSSFFVEPGHKERTHVAQVSNYAGCCSPILWLH